MSKQQSQSSVEKLTAMRFGKKSEKKSYTTSVETGPHQTHDYDHEHKSPTAAEKKGKKVMGKNSKTQENPKYFDVRDTYKKHTIKEGPEWGAESAAKFKSVTPGQENADQVPKTEETPEPDQIQALVNKVAKRIMGLKEAVFRYGTDWNTIREFLEMYDEKGIDYLVEVCKALDARRGKPLRKIIEQKDIEEDVNPDEFMSEGSNDKFPAASKLVNKYDDHHEIISSAINHFGTGGHPQANRQNLGFFKKKYVKSTLEKARKHVGDDSRGKLEAAIKHVDSLKEETVDEDTQDELKTKARKAKSYAIGHERKSVNAFDRGDDHEMDKHEVQHDKQQKKYHSTLDKFRKQRNVDNVRKIK